MTYTVVLVCLFVHKSVEVCQVLSVDFLVLCHSLHVISANFYIRFNFLGFCSLSTEKEIFSMRSRVVYCLKDWVHGVIRD